MAQLLNGETGVKFFLGGPPLRIGERRVSEESTVPPLMGSGHLSNLAEDIRRTGATTPWDQPCVCELSYTIVLSAYHTVVIRGGEKSKKERSSTGNFGLPCVLWYLQEQQRSDLALTGKPKNAQASSVLGGLWFPWRRLSKSIGLKLGLAVICLRTLGAPAS